MFRRLTAGNLLATTDSDTMVMADLGETWLSSSRQVTGQWEGGLDASIRRVDDGNELPPVNTQPGDAYSALNRSTV
jgi:hypothetical protein